MSIVPGSWLGVDVGSNRSKVYSFCLLRSEGNGRIQVFFERGQVRGPANGQRYPGANGGAFQDLARPTWLSQAAEEGARQILENSELVTRWRQEVAQREARAGACVDTPCGFAATGYNRRNTEEHAVQSFPTPSLATFVDGLTTFSREGNYTPLGQRYFWKLIGLVAFRQLLQWAEGNPYDMPLKMVTTLCVGGQPIRIREGFPSDSYARANGIAGKLAEVPRKILAQFANAAWQPTGNHFNNRSSQPTSGMLGHLLTHRDQLVQDISNRDAFPSMKKITPDRSWADLWDAFTCAFVSCCDAHGAAMQIGTDPVRLNQEGAIITPCTASRN